MEDQQEMACYWLSIGTNFDDLQLTHLFTTCWFLLELAVKKLR